MSHVATLRSRTPPLPGTPAAVFGKDARRQARRVHIGVLLFFAVDALLLTGYGWIGTISIHLGWLYGVVGGTVSAALIVCFWRRGARVSEHDALAIALCVVACTVMLTTLALAPQVGVLMLMSLMAVMALSALQLKGPVVLALCIVLPCAALSILQSAGLTAGIPTATAAERLLTGLWLGWLMAKCSAHNIAGTELRHLVNRANADLAAALQALEVVAATDVLTTLPNRRSIIGALDRALDGRRPRDARVDGPVAGPVDSHVGVALFDLDYFKQINDRYGHEVGDEVLLVFAQVASSNLRPDDKVGRYGGEEFLLVLHRVRDARAAFDAADRVRREVDAYDWSGLAPGLAVTVSVGVALVEAGEEAAGAIRRADSALYDAKRLGRNQVVLARRAFEHPASEIAPA